MIDLDAIKDAFDKADDMDKLPDKSKFSRYADPDTVIDENQTVKWNREEVARRNEAYKKEKARIQYEYNCAIGDAENLVREYITQETGLPKYKSAVIWNKIYDNHHSFFTWEALVEQLDEEIKYIKKIIE